MGTPRLKVVKWREALLCAVRDNDETYLVAPVITTRPPCSSQEVAVSNNLTLSGVFLDIPKDIFKTFPVVGEVTEQDVKDVLTVSYCNYLGFEELPDDLKSRVGLPILDEEDPRLHLQREQSDRLSDLRSLIYEWWENAPALDEDEEEVD
jgi:hypothetical protein